MSSTQYQVSSEYSGLGLDCARAGGNHGDRLAGMSLDRGLFNPFGIRPSVVRRVYQGCATATLGSVIKSLRDRAPVFFVRKMTQICREGLSGGTGGQKEIGRQPVPSKLSPGHPVVDAVPT